MYVNLKDSKLFLRQCFLASAAIAACFSVARVYAEAPGESPRELAKLAIAAAGGVDHLPVVLHWKETWSLGETGSLNPREAYIVPPHAWYQDGRNIAEGNPDRTEKAYLVWVWTLAPLADADTKLTWLPEVEFSGKTLQGLRVQRDKQPDIDLYFDRTTHRLSALDWRAFRVDFSDWKETDGYHYASKANVRFKSDGRLHLKTEFQTFEKREKLPPGVIASP